MLYLDTSLLVTFLTAEERTDDVSQWLKSGDPGAMAISNWVVAEFSAALFEETARQQNNGERARELTRQIQQPGGTIVCSIPGRDRHLLAAARLSDREKTGLRTGDALHLAIAVENGARLCTLDKGLAKAGLELGVATQLI